MKELSPREEIIEGSWVLSGTSVQADDLCERIEWLTNEKLNKISVDGDNWDSLYQDPKDKRYWLLTYPQSHLHGGGPPSLINISTKKAQERFNVK